MQSSYFLFYQTHMSTCCIQTSQERQLLFLHVTYRISSQIRSRAHSEPKGTICIKYVNTWFQLMQNVQLETCNIYIRAAQPFFAFHSYPLKYLHSRFSDHCLDWFQTYNIKLVSCSRFASKEKPNQDDCDMPSSSLD